MLTNTNTQYQERQFEGFYQGPYQSIYESTEGNHVIYYPDSNQLWLYGSMTDDMVFWKYRDVLKPILKNPSEYEGMELHLYDIQLSTSTSKRLIQLLKTIRMIDQVKMVWHYDLNDLDQHGIVYQFSASFDYQIFVSPIRAD